MRTPDEIKTALRYLSITDISEKLKWTDDVAYAYQEEAVADALAYIEQLEAALPQWISVDERLPEAGTLCIVFGHKRRVKHMDLALRGTTGTWEFGMASSFEITHWMPLPQPPEEEENEIS